MASTQAIEKPSVVELSAAHQERLVEGARQMLTAIAYAPPVYENNNAACMDYMRKLHPNVLQYTKSGAAPAQMATSGSDVAVPSTASWLQVEPLFVLHERTAYLIPATTRSVTSARRVPRAARSVRVRSSVGAPSSTTTVGPKAASPGAAEMSTDSRAPTAAPVRTR